MRVASEDELRMALDAIGSAHPDAEVLARGAASTWVLSEGSGRVIYLDADSPDDLPAGALYTTWVVSIYDDGAVRVSRFRSRKAGGRGDETLPSD